MLGKTQRIAARVIAVGLWGYALMLAQANPAQGTASYLREIWGFWGIQGFIFWFIVSGLFLFFAKNLVDIYWAILSQVGYFVVAIAYVFFDGILRDNGAQWGALTTHGFGTMMLCLILYLLARLEMRAGNDI